MVCKKKIALVVCSNGLKQKKWSSTIDLIKYLNRIGIETVCTPFLYCDERNMNSQRSGTAIERANILNQYFDDDSIEAIFDISGGNIANEILPYLDYELIKHKPKVFYGYSDVTTVCNAIFTMSGASTGLFQLKTLVWDRTGNQKKWFTEWDGETDIKVKFISGSEMTGVCIGGNIRCFLKLTGTRFFPDLKGKILVLESLGGELPRQIPSLVQLSQIDGFRDLNGIILGTFSETEKAGQYDMLLQEVVHFANGIPIAVTKDIGHGSFCKCIRIGKKYYAHV